MKRITKALADKFARKLFGTDKFDEVDYYEGSEHVIDYRIGWVQFNIFKYYGSDAPRIPKGIINPVGSINFQLLTVAYVELLENGGIKLLPYGEFA